MRSRTRELFNAYMAGMARSNGTELVRNEPINYTPDRQQLLFQSLGEQADFLGQVNHIPVTAQVGQKIGLGINKPIAGRTDTEAENGQRKTRYVGELSGDEYHAKQTNFDTHLPYRLVDSWAHAGDFAQIYINQILKQIARDQLMVGWNGETAANNTDLETYPLLQDVNVGWIEKVRANQPVRIMGYDSAGVATDDQWQVGEGGHYNTLDTLVFDMITNLLEAWHQGSDDLVVMVGREVWVAHGMSLLSHSTLPTERNALQTWFAAQTVAGLPAVMPPFIPSRAVIVTSYKNLSIYHQLDTLRRTPIDNPKKDRVEEYFSENQAYVVEDFGKFSSVRNGALLLPDNQGGWA